MICVGRAWTCAGCGTMVRFWIQHDAVRHEIYPCFSVSSVGIDDEMSLWARPYISQLEA